MSLHHRSSSSRARASLFRRQNRNPAFRRRLLVEHLESRMLLSTWTVLNVDDSGAGSLREAIDLSNANEGFDTIEFAIGGGGPQTIQLQSPLPTITDPVAIDGTSQPGFVALPIVEVAGTAASPVLTLAADDSTLRGLAVRTAGTAISLSGADRALVSNLDVSWTGAGESGMGIDLWESNSGTIEYVTATNRQVGLKMRRSGDNVIQHNDFSGAGTWAIQTNADTTGTGNQYLHNNLSDSANGVSLSYEVGMTLSGDSFNMAGIPGMGLELHRVSNSQISGLDVSWTGAGISGTGILVGSSSNNTIEQVTVMNRTFGVDLVSSSAAAVECTSILENATGVRIKGASSGILLNNNRIAGNSGNGVVNSAPEVVNAEYNYWGSADGPATLGGAGDTYSGNVDAEPFLTELPPCLNTNEPPVADAGGPYAIDEGDALVLAGSGSDVDDGDTLILTYSWDLNNDGTFDDATGAAPTLAWSELDALGLDDDGTFTVTLRVYDNDTYTDNSAAVTIENTAPRLVDVSVTSPIDENAEATLAGDILDPGSQDTFTLTIDWGDGTTEAVDYGAGTTSFVRTHRYMDDGPSPGNGAPSYSYEIQVTVIDKDSGIGRTTTPLTVNNVPPVIADFHNSPPSSGGDSAGEEITVGGAFSDIGTFDTHTATVDWGDGTSSPADVTQSDGSGSIFASHVYDNGGVYTITLTVTDDDTDKATKTSTAEIIGVGVNNRVLQIVATTRKDDIRVKPKGRGQVEVKTDFTEPKKQLFPADSILVVLGPGHDLARIDERILIDAVMDGGDGKDELHAGGGNTTMYGGAGNDRLHGGNGDDTLDGGPGADRLYGDGGNDVIIDLDGHNRIWSGSGADTITAGGGNDRIAAGGGDDLVLAGAGDDRVDAGRGSDVVVGGDGDDRITGGPGLDLLIGGKGSDKLQGGNGRRGPGDILIAGWTTHDADESALRSILDRWITGWNAGRPYEEIVDELVADWLDPGTTVFDDGVEDKLKGGQKARDLFFADLSGEHGDDDVLKGAKNDIVIELADLLDLT